MPDTFDNYKNIGLDSPAENGFSITPNDGADVAFITRKIYVGGAGNIALITKKGDTIIYVAVPVGTTLDVRASRVLSTGTSATNLLGLY